MVNISENLEVLEGVKDDIKTAIENKGIVIHDTTPFVDYATKINEISIGTGDYQDGYEQGKLDQKALLENRTFRRNGTYSRPDGYGTVVVDVPSGGTGDYETGFEDGVAAQKAKLTNITITNNGTYTNEDGYNEVVVNVENKIPLVNGTKLSYSTFTEIPSFYDFSEIIDMDAMFTYCSNLQTIPLIDTSNVTDMDFMFSYCDNLQTIPLIDTKNVTGMTGMFRDCGSLQTIPLIDTSNVTKMNTMFYKCGSLQTIPQLDTSNVTTMSYMFKGCYNLQTIPELDTRKVTSMNYMFEGCVKLQSLPSFNCSGFETNAMNALGGYFNEDMEYLTEVGGWINLKQKWDDSGGLACCPNLTYQSCINILNGLYDFTGNGETPHFSQGILKVHQNFLDTVGDEISIGVAKSWTITA